MITQYEKAAIIGYWRGGAPLEQICWIMGKPFWKIEKTIEEYKSLLIG